MIFQLLLNFLSLYKSRSLLSIKYQYLKFFLFYLFNIKKINATNKKYENILCSKKKITEKWFTKNIFFFNKILNDFFIKKISILEIGCYEGYSALYWIKYFPAAKLTCVDTFKGSEEQPSTKNFFLVEKNFDFNLKLQKRLKKIKSLSSDFFKKIKDFYNIIYIDGSHKAKDVYIDAINADKFLTKDGYLIFDDYFWKLYKNKQDPIYGINKFLEKHKKKYQIIYVNQLIFLKKII